MAAARAGRDLVLSTGRYLGQVLGHKVGSTVQYSTVHYITTLHFQGGHGGQHSELRQHGDQKVHPQHILKHIECHLQTITII